jgi:hypothetical protein
MEKQILTFITIISASMIFAQVGVNTESPKSTMDISVKRDGTGVLTENSSTYGMQAPRVTRAELTANTAEYGLEQRGTFIYITDVSGGDLAGGTDGDDRANMKSVGYYYFDGDQWQNIATEAIAGQISALDCQRARLDPPSYTSGVSYSGVLYVPYTGGNGGNFSSGSPIASTGVTGLTATLQSGHLNTGSGELVYLVTGTPNASTPAIATFILPSVLGAPGCAADVGTGASTGVEVNKVIYRTNNSFSDPDRIVKSGRFEFRFLPSTSDYSFPQFRLVSAPSSNVVIYAHAEQKWDDNGIGTLGGNGFQFDSWQNTFTTSNWNQWQTIASAGTLTYAEANQFAFTYPGDDALYVVDFKIIDIIGPPAIYAIVVNRY